MKDKPNTLRQLTSQFSQTGKLEAIYLRPERNAPVLSVDSTEAIAGKGLVGDRSSKNALNLNSKRQVTLIQAEHIGVVSKLMGKTIDASLLRRNLLVSGINLLACKTLFKDQPLLLRIGDVILEITGPCEPCSKMETILGKGGYNVMRGHGGVTAKIIQAGEIKIGNIVSCALQMP